MKRRVSYFSLILLVIALVAIFASLTGCSSSSTPTATLNPTNTNAPPASSVSPSATASPTATSTATPAPSGSPTATATASPTVSPSPSASPTPTPTGPVPKAFIVSPLYNVTVQPGDVTVDIVVSDFNIVDKIGQANAPGEGHVIYYLDVAPPTAAGKPATTADGTYAEVAAKTYTWKNVAPGNHTFAIQLVNNDGTPLSPPVTQSEPVPVASPTPTASATPSPSDTASPTATSTP